MKYIALALTAPFILILGAYIVITFGFTIPPNFFMYVVGVILFVIGLLMTLIAISGISTDIRKLKRPKKSIESKRKEPVLKEKPKPNMYVMINELKSTCMEFYVIVNCNYKFVN